MYSTPLPITQVAERPLVSLRRTPVEALPITLDVGTHTNGLDAIISVTLKKPVCEELNDD